MMKKIIVGNFKMNLLKNDISNYINEIKKYDFSNVIYCPSNIYLKDFINNNLCVGAQDVSPYEEGSFTGDVSAKQLKSIGVNYCIIGHSERKKYYFEKNVLINKLLLAKQENIVPILCVGEKQEEYDKGETLKVLKDELDFLLKRVKPSDFIIAYEPIWAIGTGLIPTNEEIHNTIDYIKKYIYEKYKINIKVLYGGSVNNQNIEELEKINNIDGYLIGGASIKVKDFIDFINFVNK